MLSEDQIKEAAENRYRKMYSDSIPTQYALDLHRDSKINSFIDGAQFAQEELSPKWVPVDAMTKEQKIHFNSVDTELLMLLFDNGEIRRYNELKSPYVLIVAYYVLPLVPDGK